jgi:membrane-associated phospholipid phosphatase
MDKKMPRTNRVLLFLLAWFGLTALALAVEVPIETWFRGGWAKEELRPKLASVRFFGEIHIHFIILAIAYACRPRRKTIVEYMTLMIGASLFCEILKTLSGRARPDDDLGQFSFSFLEHSNEGANGFPSGEATAAFALATYLSVYFPRGRYVFFFFAVWAALGRLATRSHYLSDVIFGAGLGIAFVLAGHAWFTAREQPSQIETPRTDLTD